MIGGIDSTNKERMAIYNATKNYHGKIQFAKRRIFDALVREGINIEGMKHRKRISLFLTMFDFQRPIEMRWQDYIIQLFDTKLLPEPTPRKRAVKSDKPKSKVDEYRQKYLDYLKSSEWKSIREKSIIHWGGKCVLCCSTDRIQGHHRTYKNLYHETVDDVVPLCYKCHKRHHEK